MRSFQLILMHVSLVGAFALTVCWAAIAWRRGIALAATQLLVKWRRMGNLGRALLFTFVTAMILYGSTKTNQTDGVNGGTTNPPMTMAWAPMLGAGQVQNEIPQPTEGRVPANATLAQNWWRRGGWEDWRTVDFDDDWVFPHGTNHLPKVTVMSQGALRTRVSDTNAVASLGFPLAMVPFDTCFYYAHTASNSYVFTWDHASIDRNTNLPITASIELFRNGDKCVMTNSVATFIPRVLPSPPFPSPGAGQDADWIDAQVGYDEDNGLYKLTATVTNEPPEAFVLTVGEESVTIAHAGDYAFLLEKGTEYAIDTWPKGMDVSFAAVDDLGSSEPLLASWWNGYWREWTVDGGESYLIRPSPTSPGRILWMPSFCGSPDVSHLGPDSGATTFTAVLSDYRYAEAVAYHWACDDANVVIGSPNARETAVSFTSMPSWRSARLTVTTAVGTNELCSVLDLTYGTNETPQVYFDFSAPEAVLLNSNRTDNAKLRKMSLSLSSDAERSGQVRLSCLSGNDRIALWGSSNRTSRISLPQAWNAAAFTNFEAYVEGCVTSGALGDVRLKAEYLPEDDDPTEVTRDMTVVEIGEVSLPGAPDDGLVVMRGTSVLLEVDCRPAAAASLVSTVWEKRRMRGDGSYDEWAYAVANDHGCSAVYTAPTGGVYHVRVRAGVGRDGIDERSYSWQDYTGYVYGLCVPGNDKHFGVCDSQWQMTLRSHAKGYLGNSGFAKDANLGSMYGFTSLDGGSDKCNYFVAYMIRESGLPLAVQHEIGLAWHRYYPPTANDWANGAVITNWQYLGRTCYVQPGLVVGHPAGRHGHCGIVDFDGWVISAGQDNVNRQYEEWHDGTSGYNTLMRMK